MRLKHGIDLGYCTNIHRGETWSETFAGLRTYTDAVRRRVASDERYGIGLRLSAVAAEELSADASLRDAFRRWLEETNSYVFTINGFPYGTFHGSRVKEQVYAPDWTTPERLAYTNRLFDLVDQFAPEGESVSVSTLPGSFKEFIRPGTATAQRGAICRHLRLCSDHLERLRDRTGRDLHLGLEPEPLGLFETSGETVAFFEELVDGLGAEARGRLLQNVGVNYDTCHLAVEFEEPSAAIGALLSAGIRISKIHLSSALRLQPTKEAVGRLAAFEDGVYLHQVVVSDGERVIRRFKDLPEAFAWHETTLDPGKEWRVHFHVPIHSHPEALFADTREHISGLLSLMGQSPGWCRHFEMETYTWEVMPAAMRSGDVVDQLVAEYDWCLGEFRRWGLA
jgi:sugar phosphate isomerase/epimerase